MNFYNINIIFLFEKHIIVNCRFGAKIKIKKPYNLHGAYCAFSLF